MLLQQLGDVVVAVPGGLPRERTLVGKALAFLPFTPFVFPAVWSWFRVVQRAWRRRWLRPRWYARLLWTCPYSALLLWVWAILQQEIWPGEVEWSCAYAGQSFDESYHNSHPGPLPPLLNSSPCNRDYDLVAWWINPAIVILLLATVVSSGALMASSLLSATEAADSDPEVAARGTATE